MNRLDNDRPRRRKPLELHINHPASKIVYTSPTVMDVQAGTLDTGDVDDLADLGGTLVNISEANGSPALTVQFDFVAIDVMDMFIYYGHYLGSTSHVINIEIMNYTVSPAVWEVIGIISSVVDIRWNSYRLFKNDRYNNNGAVCIRFRHLGNGVSSHDLILDYVAIGHSKV